MDVEAHFRLGALAGAKQRLRLAGRRGNAGGGRRRRSRGGLHGWRQAHAPAPLGAPRMALPATLLALQLLLEFLRPLLRPHALPVVAASSRRRLETLRVRLAVFRLQFPVTLPVAQTLEVML